MTPAKCKVSQATTLTPGTYSGLWSGYRITLSNGITLDASYGYRGINIPAKVVVSETGEIEASIISE